MADSLQSAKEAGLPLRDGRRSWPFNESRRKRVSLCRGRWSSPCEMPKHWSRIKALVIPPAWTEVWIFPNPKEHLQVTGRDARGRKQSRYHPRWREVPDETKYERLLQFGTVLPGHSRAGSTRSFPSRNLTPKSLGNSHLPDGNNLHSSWKRGVCAREPFLWTHYNAQSSCSNQRICHHLQVSEAKAASGIPSIFMTGV